MGTILLAIKNKETEKKLVQMLNSNGYQVVATVDDAYALIRTLRSKEITISIIDNDLPGINGLQVAQLIAEERLGATILLAKGQFDMGSRLPNTLLGVLIKPINQFQLLNTIRLAMMQAEQLKSLHQEVDSLKETITNRKIIEKAKGLIMERDQVSEQEAYERMRKMSMEQRVPLIDIAKEISE